MDVSAHSKLSALLHTEDYLLNKLQTNSISPSKMSTGVVETDCQVIPVSFCWMSPPLGWIPTSGWPVIFAQFFFALCHLVKLWNFWLRNFCWLLLLPANSSSFRNMSFRRSMWDLLKKYRPGRASLCGNVISDSPPLTLSSPSVCA